MLRLQLSGLVLILYNNTVHLKYPICLAHNKGRVTTDYSLQLVESLRAQITNNKMTAQASQTLGNISFPLSYL